MSPPNASNPKTDPSAIPAFAPAERPFELLDAAALTVGEESEPGADVDEGRVEDNVGLLVDCESGPVALLEASELGLVELVNEEIAVV